MTFANYKGFFMISSEMSLFVKPWIQSEFITKLILLWSKFTKKNDTFTRHFVNLHLHATLCEFIMKNDTFTRHFVNLRWKMIRSRDTLWIYDEKWYVHATLCEFTMKNDTFTRHIVNFEWILFKVLILIL